MALPLIWQHLVHAFPMIAVQMLLLVTWLHRRINGLTWCSFLISRPNDWSHFVPSILHQAAAHRSKPTGSFALPQRPQLLPPGFYVAGGSTKNRSHGMINSRSPMMKMKTWMKGFHMMTPLQIQLFCKHSLPVFHGLALMSIVVTLRFLCEHGT